MNCPDTGGCLRASKSSPDVVLDWGIFGGSGNFIVRRGIIGDFGNYSLIFGPSSLKTCDDAVLEDTTSYWYDNRNRSMSDTLYFYHADHLGTPIAMTDTSGTLVWRAEHAPFGSIYALTVATISNNLRFPGQYFDSETALAQNWFRDYDAKIGRYWEVDPLGIIATSSLYNYANANPVKIKDFNGLQGSVSSSPMQTVFVCCAKANVGANAPGYKHCYIQVGKLKYELQPHPASFTSQGYPEKNPAPINPNADCAATTRCNLKDCLDKSFQQYPSGARYEAFGPNSNTFVATLAKACKLNTPKSANNSESPGWGCPAPR